MWFLAMWDLTSQKYGANAKTLEKPQMDKLYNSFEEHEEKVIGHGHHEELQQMLKDLQKKYLK